jgi:predicted lipoprotein with Yx(FWY)xxD motif
MNLSIRRMTGLLLAAGLLVAACTTAATPIPPAGGGGGLTVATGNSAALGAVLTGTDGKTLYVLTKDPANASSCTGACATTWPPLTASGGAGVTPGSGVSGTFSTFARADGSMQVAINGKPLYYFSGDSKAGDTNGQGQGGVWFAATPSGAPASGGAPAGGSPSAEPTKGGYDY